MNKLSVLPIKIKDDFKTKDMPSKSKSIARDEFAGTLGKLKSQIEKKRESESVSKDKPRSLNDGNREKENTTIDSRETNGNDKKLKMENENAENMIEDLPQQADAEKAGLAGTANIMIDKSIIKDLEELAAQADETGQATADVLDGRAAQTKGMDFVNDMQVASNGIPAEASNEVGNESNGELVQEANVKQLSETGAPNVQNSENENTAGQDKIIAVLPENNKLKDKDGQKREMKDESAYKEKLIGKSDDILGQSIKKFIVERNDAGQRFSGEEIKDAIDSIKDEITKLSDEAEGSKFPGLSSDASANRINHELMKAKAVYYSQREVVEQVINKVKITDAENLKAIEIKLEPEQLGKLTLKVVMENGVLTAKLIAESEKVKAALESSIAELKDSMLEQGLNIAAVDVSVGSGTQGEQERESVFEAALKSKRISNGVFDDILEDANIHGEKDANNPYFNTEEINYLA